MSPIDGAALARTGERTYTAQTDPAYWNVVGPFGGWIAAVSLRALALETGGAPDPLSYSIDFAGPMTAGAFTIALRELRANRSTSFWSIELTQSADGGSNVCAFATAVLARRRETPVFDENIPPAVDAPEAMEPLAAPMPLPFLQRLDMRFVTAGGFPKFVDGRSTVAWVRMRDATAFDYETLTAVCDSGLPQIFMRLRRPVPVSSVSMNVFYHAERADLAAVGDDFVLAGSRMRAARGGFFDTTTSVWRRDGMLLATTEQIVWFKP